MRLSSIHKNICEASEDTDLGTALDTSPEELDEKPDLDIKPESKPESQTPDEGKLEDKPLSEADKAQRTIKIISKLQEAAVGLEAAKFTLQTAYSDFSLAKRIDALKKELAVVINKSREHVMHSSAKSPEAERIVSQWLNL